MRKSKRKIEERARDRYTYSEIERGREKDVRKNDILEKWRAWERT